MVLREYFGKLIKFYSLLMIILLFHIEEETIISEYFTLL